MSMLYLKSLTWDVVTQIIRVRGSCIKYTTIYVLYVLILERDENRSSQRKTLEAQERSTMRNSTHMKRKPDLAWLFSGERHNALTRASLNGWKLRIKYYRLVSFLCSLRV